MFWWIAGGITVFGCLAGALWQRPMQRRRRHFGAVMLILLPVWLVIAMIVLSELLPATHWLNIWGPDGSALTPLEVAIVLTMLCTPGWIFGFVGGYMARSIQQRPLRF